MTTKYLDTSGLSYFWGKLKDKFQEKLVSGTNIKTINNNSLLGSGNIDIQGGGSVQSDWDQSDSTADDYIKNKPTIPQIQTGQIDLTSTVAANSYTDKTVTYSEPFSSPPTVTCTIFSTSSAGGIGRMTAAVTSFSKTGFTCRIFNGDTSARQPSVMWIAVAQ